MQKVYVRLMIVVTTMFLGLAAARVSKLCRAISGNDAAVSEALNVQRPSAESAPQGAPHPKVKWLYVSDPVAWNRDGSAHDASIVVFYENGKWGRITLSIKRSGSKLEANFGPLSSVELGTWRDGGLGSLLIISETWNCNQCPLLRPEITVRPSSEVWRLDYSSSSQMLAFVRGGTEKYRLLDPDQLLHFDQIVFLPFDFKDDGIID